MGAKTLFLIVIDCIKRIQEGQPTMHYLDIVGRVPVWTIIKLNISFHIYVQRVIRKGIFAAAFVSVVGGWVFVVVEVE